LAAICPKPEQADAEGAVAAPQIGRAKQRSATATGSTARSANGERCTMGTKPPVASWANSAPISARVTMEPSGKAAISPDLMSAAR
jgi:hypothetical protein